MLSRMDSTEDKTLNPSVIIKNGEDEKSPLLISSQSVDSNKSARRRKKLKKVFVFCNLWLVYLFISAAYSVISPFYPQEAEKYHVGSLSVGLIVGSSPLCVVILSPILGYFIPNIGLKFMLIAGCLLVSGAFILMGFLADMFNSFQFVLFSVLLRVTEGVGSAAYSTSLFTLATIQFPESVGTAMGLLEVGSGIGFIIGPPMGGLLYKVGGFSLPFIVTGGIVLVFVPIFMISIPSASGKKQFIPLRTLKKLLCSASFLVLSLDNVLIIAALGFFTPTLAIFLENQFGLSEFGIGLVFLCGPVFYMASSFLAGKLTDIWGPRYFIIGGFIFTGICYFFLGPTEYVSSESYLWLTCLALCGVGFWLGFGVVPIFPDMLNVAKLIDPSTEHGVMSGIIAGISSSTLCFGEFLGPIVGGALSELLSFQMAATIFGEILIAKGMLLFGMTVIDRYIRMRFKQSVPVNRTN